MGGRVSGRGWEPLPRKSTATAPLGPMHSNCALRLGLTCSASVTAVAEVAVIVHGVDGIHSIDDASVVDVDVDDVHAAADSADGDEAADAAVAVNVVADVGGDCVSSLMCWVSALLMLDVMLLMPCCWLLWM